MGDCGASVVPHSPQNLAVGRTCWPQLEQTRTSLVPHSSQNFSPTGFSNPQLAQRIGPLYSCLSCRTRRTPPPREQAASLGQTPLLLSSSCADGQKRTYDQWVSISYGVSGSFRQPVRRNGPPYYHGFNLLRSKWF